MRCIDQSFYLYDVLIIRSILFQLILLFFVVTQLSAQVAPPPPAPQGGFPVTEIPRRQWTLAIHGGMVGYSPTETTQISGHDHFSRVGGNFGINVLTDNSGRRRLSITANTSLGLSAGTILSNKKGTVFHTIEGKFEKNKACYSFQSPFFFTLQGDTFGNWVMTDKYWNYGIAYQCSFSTEKLFNGGGPEFMYVRGMFSQSFYHQNFTDRIQLGRFEDWSENGTGMRATTIQASRTSFMLSFEAGVRTFSPDWDRSFDFGIVAHLPFERTYTDQYEFIQNNNSVGVSNTSYYGSTFMLNARYTFNFKPKEREVDTTVPPPDIYVSTDTSRDIDVQESFTVHEKSVKITVWDRNEVDGDIISLFMNDELVKKNLRLKKRKKRFRVKLQPGSNILVMYAENLGTIPPNTAAVQVKYGGRKRNVNLVSDNGKSGAVEIIYEPK